MHTPPTAPNSQSLVSLISPSAKHITCKPYEPPRPPKARFNSSTPTQDLDQNQQAHRHIHSITRASDSIKPPPGAQGQGLTSAQRNFSGPDRISEPTRTISRKINRNDPFHLHSFKPPSYLSTARPFHKYT